MTDFYIGAFIGALGMGFVMLAGMIIIAVFLGRKK